MALLAEGRTGGGGATKKELDFYFLFLGSAVECGLKKPIHIAPPPELAPTSHPTS
jgi:hypothetical protein